MNNSNDKLYITGGGANEEDEIGDDDEAEYLDSQDVIEVATLDDTTDQIPMDDDDDDDDVEIEDVDDERITDM